MAMSASRRRSSKCASNSAARIAKVRCDRTGVPIQGAGIGGKNRDPWGVCGASRPRALSWAGSPSMPAKAGWHWEMSGVATVQRKTGQRAAEVKAGMIQHQLFPLSEQQAARRGRHGLHQVRRLFQRVVERGTVKPYAILSHPLRQGRVGSVQQGQRQVGRGFQSADQVIGLGPDDFGPHTLAAIAARRSAPKSRRPKASTTTSSNPPPWNIAARCANPAAGRQSSPKPARQRAAAPRRFAASGPPE